MEPEHWQKIERLYHSALELEPGPRERFLKGACAGDEALLNEVVSLLASKQNGGSLFESPALDVLAKEMAKEQSHAPELDLAGHTLLHYRIREKIGEGGMGQVYRAEDTKLLRQVAIKVLPDEFAQDAERLARLEREAKLLASLNHPNIAAIHGLEQAEGKPFLVLELVEGQTLAERLKKGRIPLDETLDICRQIAEGLEVAHEKGIIHRDLKPANVKVTPEGKVKILDFGLAKAFYDQAAQLDPSRSPTITEQMTSPGVILGTAAYMSPEQARGKPMDKRADIWAFGCILFECLAGKGAFRGDTVTETLAAVIKDQPNWSSLPADTPERVREVIRTCLYKDPARRLHDIADASIGIQELAAQPSKLVGLPRRLSLWWIAGLLAVGAIAATFVTIAFMKRSQIGSSPPVTRSIIRIESGQWLAGMGRQSEFWRPSRSAMAISSDGRFIVYSAIEGNPNPQAIPRLYIRRTDQMEAKPIARTEGGINPFLSPDDRWVGFWDVAGGKLMKVPAEGGVPATLCEVPTIRDCGPFGASWGLENNIVYSPGHVVGLFNVSADGGKPEVLTTPNKTKEEVSHRLPSYLPDGKGLLFTIMRQPWDSRPSVALLDLKTRKWRVLMEDAADARYIPSGHLVFLRRGTLLAVPFDLNRLDVTGQPVPVIANAMQAIISKNSYYNTCAGQFDVSNSGLLIYVTGGVVPNMENSLVWVDQRGTAQPIAPFKADFGLPRLSPDGQRIAYTMGSEERLNVYDLARGTASQLTGEGNCGFLTWTPDGKRLVFGWNKAGQPNLYLQTADGSSPMERITAAEYVQWPGSFTPDGATLALLEEHPDTDADIYVLRLSDRHPTPFLNSRFSEKYPEFSPDGRWLSYSSNESGREEIYVRSFANSGGKWKLSLDGGTEPLWARSGKQLFYRWQDQVWAVDVRTDTGFTPSKPRLLFEQPGYRMSSPLGCWDISVDGQRFLMVKLEERKPQPVAEMILVQNWFEELRRLCPTGK